MKYLAEHRTKQQAQYALPKSRMEKGMIVACRYTNKKGSSKALMLLILNPGYQGKIHALTLEAISASKLESLASKVGIRPIPRYSAKGIDLPKLDMVQSSNRFYGSFLRNVKKEYNDSYRTLFESKVTATFLVDYNFETASI